MLRFSAAMSDFAKFILILVVAGVGWFASNYYGQESRKLEGTAAKNLVALQGSLPTPGAARPVVLEFWGTYCGPCIASIPHLNELYAKFGPRVQFVAISSEDRDIVKAFMKEHRLNYPVAVDTTHEFFEVWGIKTVPTLIYLDANQKEQWRGHSMQMTEERLAGLLGK